MKINNKGFTLVELLGAIVIFGLLGTIATVSVNKYVISSRYKSYRTMSQSIYQAAENCIIDGECHVPSSINTTKLISKGYLDKLKNPVASANYCFGVVTVTSEYSSNEYKKYSYKVKLTCPNYKPRVDGKEIDTLTWPDAKESE